MFGRARRSTLQRVHAERLQLQPLDPPAAAALPNDRILAAELMGARLSPEWPGPDVLDIFPIQAGAPPENACFGVWVMVERDTNTVVGDIGFFGPPGPDQTVEMGYSVVPDRRRRGYATEAARALSSWALSQPGITAVMAGCDPGNFASIRTLEKVGFVRVGAEGDELRWRFEGGSRAGA